MIDCSIPGASNHTILPKGSVLNISTACHKDMLLQGKLKKNMCVFYSHTQHYMSFQHFTQNTILSKLFEITEAKITVINVA